VATPFAAVGAMSQYAIIFQAIGALLALFFIFLTYMNTKTWRWVHVTFTFLVFGATIAFCVYSAMAMRTRTAWIKYHDEKEKQVADLSEQLQHVTHGNPTNPEAPSIIGVRQDLSRVVLDRGRVWRQTTPTINPDGSVTVSTVPPAPVPIDPAAAPAAPPPVPAGEKNNLKVKDVLYAFKEGQAAPDQPLLPVFFLGEFEVTAATDTTATLMPTMPLTPQQIAAGRAPGTWSLYSIMPVDGHQWFAGLDEDTLMRLIPREPTGLPPDQYQALIRSYLKDGQPAEENDPPQNVWVELKFLQPYKVTVDAPGAELSVDAEPFNAEGQAQLHSLRKAGVDPIAGEVEFGPGPTQINRGLFDPVTAEDLVSRGVAQRERLIYRRTLTDYERKFHGIHQEIIDLNTRLAEVAEEQKAIAKSIEEGEKQVTLLTDLQAKLTEDRDKARLEEDELDKYLVALTGKLNETQAELSKLYRSNKAIGRELSEISAQLTEEIERRTREATALNQ
jgi:hypothetical protein